MLERAKGLLMARQALDEQEAFQRLRTESQRSGAKVVDIAAQLVEKHSRLVQ